MATIIRREGRRLLAEDSFFVQVKSASERKCEFRDEALDWLRALKLPYFLLSVDLRTTTLELRSIYNASSHPNYSDRRSITLCLDETPVCNSGDEMQACLGGPILRWTPVDAASNEFQQRAYEILKAWVTLEMENILLRSIGMTQELKWGPNCKPERTGRFTIMHTAKSFKAALEAMRPHVQRFLPMAAQTEGADDVRNGLLLITHYMRQHGVDPDPDRLLEVFGQMRGNGIGVEVLQSDGSNPGTPVPP